MSLAKVKHQTELLHSQSVGNSIRLNRLHLWKDKPVQPSLTHMSQSIITWLAPKVKGAKYHGAQNAGWQADARRAESEGN